MKIEGQLALMSIEACPKPHQLFQTHEKGVLRLCVQLEGVIHRMLIISLKTYEGSHEAMRICHQST